MVDAHKIESNTWTMSDILGLHHVTAIATDPVRNVEFYTKVLGLKLVKRTVNYDDPQTYHLYYGDVTGHPGTLITFFCWPNGNRGREGTGQTLSISFSVPQSSMRYWMDHLLTHKVPYEGPLKRFDETMIWFRDPDGMVIELIATSEDNRSAYGPNVDGEHTIYGLYAATLLEDGFEETEKLLTQTLGMKLHKEEGGVYRFAMNEPVPGNFIDVRVAPDFQKGVIGTGTIHHVAMRVADDATQETWRQALVNEDFNVSPVMDRTYFHSIYFHEPGGVLFEIATDVPGMTADEPLATLGTAFVLPAQHEHLRPFLEEHLPDLNRPSSETHIAAKLIEPAFTHQFVPGTHDEPTAFVLLHGTGGDENNLIPIGREVSPRSSLLSPRGKVIEDGKNRFFRRLPDGSYDREDLIERTDELSEFIQSAKHVYHLEDKKLFAMGFSNGANIAVATFLLKPNIFDGAILFRPIFPMRFDDTPDLKGKKILILAGKNDELTTQKNTEDLAWLLKGFGADVVLIWQDNGHAIVDQDIVDARKWLAEGQK